MVKDSDGHTGVWAHAPVRNQWLKGARGFPVLGSGCPLQQKPLSLTRSVVLWGEDIRVVGLSAGHRGTPRKGPFWPTLRPE